MRRDHGTIADRYHRAVSDERLAGVRGLLLDLDGVVVVRGRAIPGAPEAIARLETRAIPYAVLSNISLMSRASLVAWGRSIGIELPAERIVTALSATAGWTARVHPGRPLYVLTSDDGLTEFAGQRLLAPEEADDPAIDVAAVVIGDAPEALSRENLDRAFRLVRRGAELVGMHRNGWWLTPAGPTLDSGAFLAGLEYATGRRATIVGKPSPAIFREALGRLGRLPRRAVAMVGDDLATDIRPARRLGLRSILVLTGKHGPADPLPAGGAAGRGPDAVLGSLAEVVAALD